MSKDLKLYRTSNFQIATWLTMNDNSPKEVVWDGDRAEFVFDDFEDREKLVQEFFNQSQLQKYISASAETKARMYATKKPKVYDRE